MDIFLLNCAYYNYSYYARCVIILVTLLRICYAIFIDKNSTHIISRSHPVK